MACPLEEYRINEICVVSVTGKLDDGTSIGILYILYTARRGPEHGLPPGGVQDQRDLCRQCHG